MEYVVKHDRTINSLGRRKKMNDSHMPNENVISIRGVVLFYHYRIPNIFV